MSGNELPQAFNRRVMMKGILGGAALLGSGSLLSACTGTSTPAGGGTAAATKFSLGSSASDDVPKRANAATIKAWEAKSDGLTATINTVPHNDFQNNINTYLQGSPDDAFTWFAGYRARYYAEKDLVAPIDDVWEKVGGNYSEAMNKASTGDDGKKYFLPIYNYPWGFFYRKSVWEDKGYEVPTTFDALITLAKKMKSDKLIPIAYADKDGWPAMGTFDYLNMRLNGYQFHVDLCAHKESWDQQKVKDVFDSWKEMLPYQDPNALGATWQEAAGTLGSKKSGMYLLGSFVTQQYSDEKVLNDIEFFQFPEMAVEDRDAIEAPIDGFMLSKKAADNGAAKSFLEFAGTAEGQKAYFDVDPSNIMAAKDFDPANYSGLNTKLAEAIGSAKSISQFFDRDADPAMANNVMIPALQGFIADGKIDTANLEAQAKSLYPKE